ncbi:DUF1330 domain-containing protein [Xanthobacter dioxanivorans]|uniref:DUF1330 domain-containing protein n=1 Tax=Xanthobacter dioxanivorans TaxID=2528964 RepID=A0A974PRD5_9HYPH|nr:DUF1330 domain-containing protein [Xanthobacter dioxanivorans]QRG07984.1 DUF1330 domain-containing protein [Xanthobacter dioxanivorans]
MSKGYWFLNLDVVNPVDYITYREANLRFAQAHQMDFVIRGGDFEHLEGIKRHRNVLVEMASFDVAVTTYEAPDYRPVRDLRQATAIADLAAVEGYDGPQPSPAPPPEGTVDKPRGYWMAKVDVTDPERYKDYMAANAAPFAEYGGWFLVRGGRHQLLEGHGRARYVVVAFKDVATARACYYSPGYQRARAIRQEAAVADVVLVSGYTGREAAPV